VRDVPRLGEDVGLYKPGAGDVITGHSDRSAGLMAWPILLFRRLHLRRFDARYHCQTRLQR
jgi:hypothetical protein